MLKIFSLEYYYLCGNMKGVAIAKNAQAAKEMFKEYFRYSEPVPVVEHTSATTIGRALKSAETGMVVGKETY